jgi:hypothetical protein
MHSILISALAAFSVLPNPSLSFTAAGPNGLSGRDGLVAVSAVSLESFAQRYGLDWDGLKIANSQKDNFKSAIFALSPWYAASKVAHHHSATDVLSVSTSLLRALLYLYGNRLPLHARLLLQER